MRIGKVVVVSIAALAGLTVAMSIWRYGTGTRRPSNDIPLTPFESAFSYVGETQLQGALAKTINDVIVAPTGDVYLADNDAKQVARYAPDGRLLNTIGRPGFLPGQFAVPFSLATDTTGERLYVLDVKQARVQVFKPTGELLSSVAFGPLGLIGLALHVDSNGTIYIGGRRRFARAGENAYMVHRLTPLGQNVSSFYPLDARIDKLNLRGLAGVMMAPGPQQTIYAAQPIRSRVAQFDPDGHLVREIGREAPFYREAQKLPDLGLNNYTLEKVEPYLNKWTQLSRLIALSNGEVMITYRVHRPELATASEVFSPNGELVVGEIGSRYFPVSAGPNGVVFWRDVKAKGVTLYQYRLLSAAKVANVAPAHRDPLMRANNQ